MDAKIALLTNISVSLETEISRLGPDRHIYNLLKIWIEPSDDFKIHTRRLFNFSGLQGGTQ